MKKLNFVLLNLLIFLLVSCSSGTEIVEVVKEVPVEKEVIKEVPVEVVKVVEREVEVEAPPKWSGITGAAEVAELAG